MNTEAFERKLTAILSAYVKRYTLPMRGDEDKTIWTLMAYRTAIAKLVEQYRGRVLDSPGDNVLAEFGTRMDAVNCAVEIQREFAENRRMKFRIGINLGGVIEEGKRIYGNGINIPARMEALAQGGGICRFGTVYNAILQCTTS